MPTHETDIEFGQVYRDAATNFTGTAVAAHFYLHGEARVTLAKLDQNGAVSEQSFVTGRLEPSVTPIHTVNGTVGFAATT
jgi:hypothetical protein